MLRFLLLLEPMSSVAFAVLSRPRMTVRKKSELDREHSDRRQLLMLRKVSAREHHRELLQTCSSRSVGRPPVVAAGRKVRALMAERCWTGSPVVLQTL